MARSGNLLSKVRGSRSGRAASKTRKSAATRERIMQAARELIRERGGFDFQMSEVSEACHLSKGSLYYYFGNRDELVEAVCNSTVDDFVDAIEQIYAESTSAMDAIVDICYELVGRFGTEGSLSMVVMRELCGKGTDAACAYTSGSLARVTDVLTRAFERAKQEGRIKPGVSSRVAAMALLGVFVMSAAMPRTDGGSRLGREDVRELIGFALRGVGTDAERRSAEALPAGAGGA